MGGGEGRGESPDDRMGGRGRQRGSVSRLLVLIGVHRKVFDK